MKINRILAFILVLIIAIFIWVFGKILPDIYLGLGQKNYEIRNYKEAYANLKMAVLLSPKNREARYYYVQTLLNLPPKLYVQRAIYKISQANLSDAADLIADRQILKWRNQINLNVGENYIEQVPFNNKILRWDVAKFPLKVYIQNNSMVAPDYYETEIQRAFLQWQESSGNLINFKFITNEEGGREKEANIKVSINSSANIKKCNQEDCKYTVAYTNPTISGDLLKRMEILFYDSNNLGQPFSQEEVYATALHEIGHSLGIMGHSYNKDDIMYMETHKDNAFLSSIDLNTLSLLYKLIPDITNTSLSKFDTSRQFFAPIVMGNDEQINSRKMLEAQNYINSAPDLPNGYIDLASAYLDAKQYNRAIEALEKSLSLCSNDEERFMVYYNFAIIYMQVKDWENSLKYANLAKQLKPSSDIDGLIAMINYNLGNKDLAKKCYVEALQKSPDNIIDAYNLATIYIREFNLVQAGKTLNRLIEANPDAKADSRIKRYEVIILLFK